MTTSTTPARVSIVLSAPQWVAAIYRRLTDPVTHPRIAFLCEYMGGLLTIVFVYGLTRAAYVVIVWIDDATGGTKPPEDVHWYLPFSFSRALVTVIDSVALTFVTITSIVALIKLVVSLVRHKV